MNRWPDRTDLSLLLLILIWGINYSLVKDALSHFSPLSFNGLRFAMASGVMFLLIGKSARRLPAFGADWPRVIAVGVLGNVVYQILFIVGMRYTLAGNTSLILATTPVFVAMFALLLDRERVAGR